jgi:hypothetical protein
MANEYVATLSNRIYVKSESDHPAVNNMEAAELAPVTSLQILNNRRQLFRRDKTGFRGDTPVAGPQRELVEFTMEGYGTGWSGGAAKPAVSAILESGFCRATALGAGYPVQAASGANVTLSQDAPLTIGAGLAFGAEIRFVEAISGPRDFTLNAAFSMDLTAGAMLEGCAMMQPGDQTRAMAVLDTWTPSEAVQRLMTGAVSDKLTLTINNDFLEFSAKGYAKALLDNVSGAGGAGFVFPPPPALANAAAPIAGHLGQAWIGAPAGRVCTLTQAVIRIDNNIEPRTEEFGCYGAKDFVLGRRKVALDFTLYGRNDELSNSLYAKAVNQEPVPITLQIGNQPGSMFAIYLPAVLLPVPAFNDAQPRLLWQFRNAVAMGPRNDEIFVAMR